MRALLTILILFAVGCTGGPLSILDSQVAGLMGQYQADTLGTGHVNDPYALSTLTDRPGPSEKAYTTDIAGDNDLPADLPATAAPPVDPEDELKMPQLLEDDSGVPPFDMQKLLAYAIANSREYRNEKESLFFEALDLLSEQHLWGPRFFDTFSSTVSGTPEGGDHDQAISIINELRVTHRLPFGGEVSASALVNYVNALRNASGGARETQDAQLEFAITLPLMRGAGWVARENLVQSQRNLVYSVRAFERFRREFLLNISTRYYDLIRQQEQIANTQRQVKNNEWFARRTKALADAGREPYFAVQQAQQQVLFGRNDLLNAQESYASQLDVFKIQIGMPTEQKLRIVPTQVIIPTPLVNRTPAVKTALRLRLDLQTTIDQIDDAKRGVANARNDLLPDLDFTADLTLNTDADKDIAGIDLDAGDSSYSAGLRLGLPLDRRQEQIDLRRAKIRLDQAIRSHSLFHDRVIQQVRRSLRQIEQSKVTLALQDRNVAISKTRMRGVQLNLRKLGPREFLESQEDLLEARNRRDSAGRNLRVSILQYLLDSGQMRVNSDGQWLSPAKLAPIVPPDSPPDSSPDMPKTDDKATIKQSG